MQNIPFIFIILVIFTFLVKNTFKGVLDSFMKIRKYHQARIQNFTVYLKNGQGEPAQGWVVAEARLQPERRKLYQFRWSFPPPF